MTRPSIPGPWRRSLRARLVAYFLVLSGVTVAVVGAVVYLRATEDLTASEYDRLVAVAEVKADAIDRWIDEQRRNVVFVGAIPGFGDSARQFLDPATQDSARQTAEATLDDVLDVVVRQTSDAQEFLILDLDGTVRLSTVAGHEGVSQADEPYFTDGSSHTVVQNAHTSTLTGQPTITIGTPLFDANGLGRRVGVLAANLNLERIDRIILEGTGLGEGGATYLVGPDKRFLHTRLNEGVSASGVSSRGIDAALSGQDGQALYTDHAGVPVIGVYRWLPEHEAALLVELPQATAFAPAQELALTIAIVGLLSALLLAIGMWLIARQVTRPITQLASTATAVAGGDLTATASVTSEDEVGRLTVAFNDMTAQLRENVATLERRVEERTAELTAALGAQEAAEEGYRRLVEELPMTIYTDKPDATSTSTYISPRVEDMFGYPPERWMEETFFDSVVHPDDRDRVVAQHSDELVGLGDRGMYEYRIFKADGGIAWIRDDQWVVRDAAGTPLYTQGFMIDITAEVDARAELARQKAYFESLVEISPAAVVTMDRDERVTGWNPSAERLFGYAPEEAMGRIIDELIMDTEAMREEGAGVAREAFEAGRASRVTSRATKDGHLADVEIVMVPLVVDGEHTGFYAVYHDVTELQAARHEADAANQAKSAFLAAMSHEIRTPMNAIIGMSGLLVDTRLDDEQRDYAETIRSSSDALLTIINDILDFSKIEAGKVELEQEPFDLRRCIEGAIDVIAPTAAAKQVELVYSIDPGLPRAIVGDTGRVRQIALNLLSNAVKFTEAGEVELAAAGRSLGNGRWQLTIDVRDTGIGIPADQLGRLFESFSQADASISRRFGGTGLGLAISRRLAEAMGGSLQADSAGLAGQGSTFHLVITAAEAADAAAPVEPEPVELAGKPVLVVDDNETNRRILVAQLSRWAMEVTATGDPAEALAGLREGRRVEIVLADLRMPTMDGLELAAAVRATLESPPPVVILSSLGERMPPDAPIAASLTKPVKPSALHDTLMTVLAGAPGEAAANAPVRPSVDPDFASRRPLHILLAEDNAVNQKLALRLLERMGYTADVAGDGVQTIAALELTSYDLVLMDVQMPEMDGLEATRRIRERWGSGGPWIVAMTANAMAGDREACLAAGMDDYLSKPIRVDALVAALARGGDVVAGRASV